MKSSTNVQALLAEGYRPEHIYIDGNTVARILGVSRRCLDRWRARGAFIPPKTLQPQTLRYCLADVLAWVQSQPNAGEEIEA